MRAAVVLTGALLLSGRAGAQDPAGPRPGPDLVPWPRSVELGQGELELRDGARIAYQDEALAPLARVLAGELALAVGAELAVARGPARPGDVALTIRPGLDEEEYELAVGDVASVAGGSCAGAAWGSVTLLQLARGGGGAVSFPRLAVADRPAHEWRGVMLDVARFPHPLQSLKEAVELLRLYKTRYLHLHLADDQAFTFQSRALPDLPTPGRHYTLEELRELVAFADARGVTIVPELDLPGHAALLGRAYPELFGTVDPATGAASSTGVVNMTNERAYQALDALIGELCEVFASSPYVHVGADEVGAGHLRDVPEYAPYVAAHGLERAAQGDVGELLCHFIARLDELVKARGRRTIVWEGFPGTGTENARVPADVIVMAWDCSYNPPQELARNGYALVNCAWVPLYVVGAMNLAAEPRSAYAWDARRFDHWRPGAATVLLPDEAPVLGAQVCLWEQTCEVVAPLLRSRLPAVAERIWNPDARRGYGDFARRAAAADERARRVVQPVRFRTTGLSGGGEQTFAGELSLALESATAGAIRYELADEWEAEPDPESPVYAQPLRLGDTRVVVARLFDAGDRPLGGVTRARFERIEPCYRFRAFAPAPRGGWGAIPDLGGLPEVRAGVLGRATPERVRAINRALFAQVEALGHVDTRVHDLWNPFALELTGQIRIPRGGEHVFAMRTNDGLGELEIGGARVVTSAFGNGLREAAGPLEAGTYPFRIRYFYRLIQNELNLKLRLPGAQELVAFDELVLPLAEHVAEDELLRLPAGARFEDAERRRNRNLALDRPVRVSGGSEGAMVPENAVDGRTGNDSSWHASPYPQWLEVDLGQVRPVQRVKPYFHHDGARYYRYTISLSTDRESWRMVVDLSQSMIRATEHGIVHTFGTIDARYVRIDFLHNSANPGVHLNELMVFGPGDPVPGRR